MHTAPKPQRCPSWNSRRLAHVRSIARKLDTPRIGATSSAHIRRHGPCRAIAQLEASAHAAPSASCRCAPHRHTAGRRTLRATCSAATPSAAGSPTAHRRLLILRACGVLQGCGDPTLNPKASSIRSRLPPWAMAARIHSSLANL